MIENRQPYAQRETEDLSERLFETADLLELEFLAASKCWLTPGDVDVIVAENTLERGAE